MDVGQFFVHGKTNLPLDEKQPTNSSECKSSYLELVGFRCKQAQKVQYNIMIEFGGTGSSESVAKPELLNSGGGACMGLRAPKG